MMSANEISTMIWDLADCLHGLIFSPDRLSSSIIRLLFLKYAVDNSIGATDVESMQYCARAQKMFAIRDIETGLDTIIPVLRNIDRAYKLDQIISSNEVIDQYAAELFGMDRLRQKKNVNDQSFKRVMDKLGSLDLEETSGSYELGRKIVDTYLPVMALAMGGSKHAGEQMTSLNLANLAKAILNVEKHDTFCDFASGKGASTIEITGDTLPYVINVDIDREAAAMSAMLLIMYGYSHFSVTCGDSLAKRLPDVGGNKIFVDSPLGIKLERTDDNKFSDGTLTIIDRVIHGYLAQDGIAVITSPSGPLFRQGPAKEIKNEIITLGLLHAVIALPPMWSGVSIGTNLLILGKKPSYSVLFVDATDRAISNPDRKRAKLSNILSKETLQEIADVVHDPHDIPGFARVVASTEIISREFNLVPANYIIKQAEEDTTTLSEIDEQLADLYRQLNL